MLFFLILFALQSTQAVALKKFEVVRVNPSGMETLPESLRPIFADPTPGADAIDTVEEAAVRAGFTPRLPKSENKPEFGVMPPIHGEATISISELTAALSNAQATDVVVPQDWNNVKITIQQGAGVLADYGDFLITQAPPLTITSPVGFPLDRFMETVFRIVGMSAADARVLREKFAANPTAFFPIPPRFEMDIHEMHLNSGSGMILQNADKVGDLACAWSTADRSYFITGHLTEAQVVEIANSLK
jgi:hypothetical protein